MLLHAPLTNVAAYATYPHQCRCMHHSSTPMPLHAPLTHTNVAAYIYHSPTHVHTQVPRGSLTALDVGAGIGRVTKHVLIPAGFSKVRHNPLVQTHQQYDTSRVSDACFSATDVSCTSLRQCVTGVQRIEALHMQHACCATCRCVDPAALALAPPHEQSNFAAHAG
jgi:hypothetical protein